MFKFTPIKIKLTDYYKNNEFDLIGDLPGFKIIEKCDHKLDQQNKHDCIWYVTNKISTKITGLFSFSNWLPEDYCHVAHLQPDDLIIYHGNESGSNENHIGIYRGKGNVESKFGYGHVYLHPLAQIPSYFGPYVSFFTRQKDNNLGNYATLENMEKWIALYGSICSLHITFTDTFPKQRQDKILDFIKNNPNYFMQISSSFSFNIETKASSSSYVYRVKPDFLLDPNNRKMLTGNYESLTDITKNENIKLPAKRLNTESLFPSLFSYTVEEALAAFKDDDLITVEEENKPRDFKRLKKQPANPPQEIEENNTPEEKNNLTPLNNKC